MEEWLSLLEGYCKVGTQPSSQENTEWWKMLFQPILGLACGSNSTHTSDWHQVIIVKNIEASKDKLLVLCRETKENHFLYMHNYHLPCQRECRISSGWTEISASSCGEGKRHSLGSYRERSLQGERRRDGEQTIQRNMSCLVISDQTSTLYQKCILLSVRNQIFLALCEMWYPVE